MEIKKTRNSVYQIGYHMIWCTKYRKKVLDDEISKDLIVILNQIATDHDFIIKSLEIMNDHVHLFVEAGPNQLISEIVKKLKGVSAILLFRKHPSIKKSLYGGHLWNPSYYVGTVGNISEETVLRYIENQKLGA